MAAFSILIYIRLYNQKKLKHAIEKKQLAEAQLEIQEQTLRNISQEIHDNIGQTLSLVKLNLNTIDFGRTEQVEQKIGNSKELVSKAINDLRALSKILSTDYILSAGFINAISLELQQIEKAGYLKSALSISGQPFKPEPQKELVLFRIVQESLNNIIKHSEAGFVKVEAVFEESCMNIWVIDDGKGFDPAAVSDGIGLRNMRTRALLIGGSLKVHSTPGSGTRIQISLPIQP
ncbi:MAG TPA: sensor histidine kinase [Flavisolibacter sp.]|nr:sensor histidine kinase [Flavisolibacter sp.]